LQWIAVAGLRGYHNAGLAAAISCRWMINVDEVYRRSGKLVEKYDVMNLGRSGRGGEYPTQDGFGCTNGVMRKLTALYPAYTAYADAAQCPGERSRPAKCPASRSACVRSSVAAVASQ